MLSAKGMQGQDGYEGMMDRVLHVYGLGRMRCLQPNTEGSSSVESLYIKILRFIGKYCYLLARLKGTL